MRIERALTIGLWLCLAAYTLAADEAVLTVAENVVQTPRCRIEVGPNGLPSQIVVAPDIRELPLEMRGGVKLPESVLARIGRGRRLRAPMRLEAEVEGQRLPAKVARTAKVVRQADGNADCTAAMAVGPYNVVIDTRYQADGAVAVRLTYRKARKTAGSLELVLDLVGPVTLAYRPPDGPASLAGKDLTIGQAEGIVWSNLAGRVGQKSGLVKQLFVGTGDGGFAWQCEDANGWTVDDRQPTMILERDEVGRLTWRVLLVNAATEFRGKRTVQFTLTTQPARIREAGCRRAQWLAWAAPDATVLPAAAAAAFGATGRYCEMTRGAGADMVSATQDNIDLYRPSAFRLAAATWSNLTTRIRSNVRQLRLGDEPAFDRQILGRALLHDIGVAIEGVDQPVEHLRLLEALRQFGYFEDADTEFIPYWRSGGVVRFGEGYDPSSAFKLTEENPAAHTYVSVYRRPHAANGKRGYKAMFVIMNERSKPVRHRLFVLAPERLLGSEGSTLTGLDVIKTYEFGTVPDDSDWRRSKLSRYTPMFRATGLMDAEDGGYVKASIAKGQTAAIYGPIYIRRHDYRIVYGHWLPPDPGRKRRARK